MHAVRFIFTAVTDHHHIGNKLVFIGQMDQEAVAERDAGFSAQIVLEDVVNTAGSINVFGGGGVIMTVLPPISSSRRSS